MLTLTFYAQSLLHKTGAKTVQGRTVPVVPYRARPVRTYGTGMARHWRYARALALGARCSWLALVLARLASHTPSLARAQIRGRDTRGDTAG